MKKLVLITVCAVAASIAVSAQTKEAVLAMQQARNTTVQNGPTIQSIQPEETTLAISGYYQQNFENTLFPPAGWRVENVNGPTYTWARSTAQAHLSTASAFIRYDNIAGGGLDWLIAPHYTVTASTDSLVFWMRLAFVGYQPDSLAIKVSTTDSLSTSFTTTLLLLREGTNYPANSTTWYRYAVSLQNYVGQQIYLGFKHMDIDGDGLYIDDIAIGTLPANDVTAASLTAPAAIIGAGSIIPAGSVMNIGTATQTFNVTTTINPGGYTSTTTVTSLTSNGTAPVSFAAWNATPGTYTVKMFTELAGDANVTNDTITRIVTVVPTFPNSGWSNSAALPAGRWATGPVFVKPCLSSTDTGFIYLISGADAAFANTTLNTRYNTVTGLYVNLAPIPQSRTQISPVEVNGKIYVIGGYGGSFAPVTTNSIYDIATDTWTTGLPIPQQTGDYAVGVYNDSLIYIVGGYSGTADLNIVQIYDTYLNTWSTGTPMTGAAVAGCRMGISGNNIVLVGGYSQILAATQATAYLGVITPAAPGTITWTSLPNYPAGTAGRHGAGVPMEDNGRVYFAGGDPNGQGTSTIASSHAYNTTLSQWENGPNMPVGVSNITNLAGAIRNDTLYMVTMGGYTGVAVSTQNAWLNIGPGAPAPMVQNDTMICMGNSVQLNAMNAQAYSWTPSATLNNPSIANPVSTSTATVTYTVTMDRGYGCPVVDMLVLTVNPLPTVVANSSAAAVCAGMPVTLTGSGAVSYTWTASVTDNVAFTPVVTDTYTVTGTDANGCMNTATTTVTVNALPTVVANSTTTTVCNGSPVTLSGSGATSYTWTGLVTDNAPFNPSATDTYTVTGTDGNGCTNTDMVTVTVNALPTVVANTTATAVCDGSPATLTGSGATSYIWSGGVTDAQSFIPVATLTYTVTGTDANGCMNVDSVNIQVNPNPSVTVTLGQDTACTTAGNITLNGESPVGGTWSGSGVTGNTFDPVAAGVGNIMIMYVFTDVNGCSGMATDSIWVDVCNDITSANNGIVSLMPNPSSGVFTIQLAAAPAAPVTIEITNELGQIVQTITMTSSAQQIDISAQSNGIYFVRMINGETVSVQRIVKK